MSFIRVAVTPVAERRLATVVMAVLGAVVGLSLSGCAGSFVSDALGAVTPYKVEIVQGNVVTREQMQRVKVGMSRDDLRGLLGAPLLTDAFHGDRWDYAFTLRRSGNLMQRQQVVAWFEGDKLKRIDAPNDLPSEVEFLGAIAVKQSPAAPVKLELTDEERKALPTPARGAAPPSAPTGATRPYPALEPPK